MQADDYQTLAMRTENFELTPSQRLNNAALGMTGESGEVADIIKKLLFHGHDIDEVKLKKELGDVLWYVAQAATAMGWQLSDIMALNIEKLRSRYPDGFSHEASRNRLDS